jgi:HSP20 family protein
MANIKHIDFIERKLGGLSLRLVPEVSGTWQPAADVFLTEGHVVIVLEAAGAEPRNIDVTYETGRLIVRGYRQHPAEGKSPRSFVRMEIPHGYFERTFDIPVRCDAETISATYHDGLIVIEARIAKSELPREIPIR